MRFLGRIDLRIGLRSSAEDNYDGTAYGEVYEQDEETCSGVAPKQGDMSIGWLHSTGIPKGRKFHARRATARRNLVGIIAVGVTLFGPSLATSMADTAVSEPWFHLSSISRPGNLTPSNSEIIVTAINVGDATANGIVNPVKIVDTLPAGLKALAAEGDSQNTLGKPYGPVQCTVTSVHVVECLFKEGTLPPFDQIEVAIKVGLEAGAHSGEVNQATLTGGGAPNASVSHSVLISGAPTPFGVEEFAVSPEEPGGSVDTQAGSHPYQLTTTLNLNETSVFNSSLGKDIVVPAALPKDVDVKLPAGLIGNPTAYPRCTLSEFSRQLCAEDTALGVAVSTFFEAFLGGVLTVASPIYNVEPSAGEPARFAFAPAKVPVFLNTSIRTGEDYGVTVAAMNVPQAIGFLSSTLTFWGAPGDTSHNSTRGESCLEELTGVTPKKPCETSTATAPPAFLALPVSCTGEPLPVSVEVDSWAERGRTVSPTPDPSEPLPALDGCGLLSFASELKAFPETQLASTPTGFDADVHVPQEEALNASGLAPADPKGIKVVLPQGMQLNASAAGGLQACSEAQIGYTGENPVSHVMQFTPAEPSCPDASKIANVTIKTPLLPAGQYLKGFVYLAAPQNYSAGQQENPFRSLIAAYIVAKDPVSGVLVKLSARGTLNESTGQVTAIVENSPQVPFEDAEFQFFEGPRAALATPAHCGPYTTDANFTPWSSEEVLTSLSQFQITGGPGGGACPGAVLPFSPSLTAYSANVNAGAFSALSTSIARQDGNQNLQSATLHFPPGMSGVLTGVALCPEAQANAGTCGLGSLIGESTASVGVGADPYTVTGGKVYLTEKYDGSPFGLSIVVPATAGPFTLQQGRPVVVRARIDIDPHTAALTVTTGAIPHIIEGVPLQIQHVNVTITRPGFSFNPTSCSQQAITGSLTGGEGADIPVSVPFGVTNCAALKFAPKFMAATSGKTSKADGASLTTRIVYPTAAQGTQANIAKVKVDLPIQLPSRLTTLQKACLAAVFEANPASCPEASIVGHATVTTPVLPEPLTGNAYFVSHGGEAFPSLTMVLKGYGVTIVLVGNTLIRKGITSTTFNSAPDVPFNTFELTLPEGKYSALAANGNLCQAALTMPTAFLAQNGSEIHESTPITVQGCPNTITITAHKIKGHTITLTVAVPAAGKLTATGTHLTKTTKTSKARETITLTIKTSTSSPHTTTIKLHFTPTKGKTLTHTQTIKNS